MPELSAYLLLSLLLISSEDGNVIRAEGAPVPPGPTPPSEDNASAVVTDGSPTTQPGEHQVHTWPVTTPAPPLSLRVWVKDASSQRSLGGASVVVFVEGVRAVSAVTGADGEVLMQVPYALGHGLSIVATMDGYLHRQLPWRTARMPIFSSVTLALQPMTQANIWLFEDSVLITRKTSEYLSQPSVQFSKSLLQLPEHSNISMVTAFLTVPPIDKDCHLCTTGLLSNRSGVVRSLRLSPVAIVSTQLLANGRELPVSGPITITVPLGHTGQWRLSDSIHAWAFDNNTGAWLHKGLGTVKKDGRAFVWTYVANQLGDWLAAPIPPPNGYGGHGPSHPDALAYQTYLLLGTLAATLLIAIGLLSLLLCHCRHASRRKVRRRRGSSRVILQKDQTTSTSCDAAGHGDHSFSLATMAGQRSTSSTPRHQASYNIYVDDITAGRPFKLYENVGENGAGGAEGGKPQMPSVYVNSDEVARLREMSNQGRAAQAGGGAGVGMDTAGFQEKLFHIYNQSVAIVPAPELFAGHPPLSAQSDASGCRSATFPRNGAEHGTPADRNLKDSFTQTLPKNSTNMQQQQDSSSDGGGSTEQPPLEGAQGPVSMTSANPAVWGRYSHLLESVSVPGTLNEAVGMRQFRSELQGISEQTLVELSKGKPSSGAHPPRAWFVSLDGKPAASVRHSVIEFQGLQGLPVFPRHHRHRPGSSNDTSLDSGVDMNEHLQQQPLLRGAPSLGAMARAGGVPQTHQEEPDLSSSEVGSPDDGSLRHTLGSSSGATAASSISERDMGDTSSESRGTPPPRRPRKVREKGGRAEKKSGRHVQTKR